MKHIYALLLTLCLLAGLCGCGKENSQQAKARAYMDEAAQIRSDISLELAQGYTPEDPLVIVDPFGLSPLTALLGFTTEEDTAVSLTVLGRIPQADISQDFGIFRKIHLLPVLGLYGGEENRVELRIRNSQGEETRTTLKIRTEPLPSDLPSVEVRVAQAEKMAPGVTFFQCPVLNAAYPMAIDCQGQVRWFFVDKSFGGGLLLAHLKNGNMTLGSGQMDRLNPFLMNDLYEITPLGEFVREYRLHGVHHDVVEKDNGNLLFCTSPNLSPYMFDRIQEVDRSTGKVLQTWDLRDILPMETYEMAEPYKSAFPGGETNWFHLNSLCYLPEENAFLISGRHQDAVMKIHAETREILWIFSGTIGKENPAMAPYLLTPITEPGEEFEYPRAQHAALQTPEGDLMLFDNANFRETDETGVLLQDRLYSRAVRYEIDEENRTVRQTWQYGKQRGTQLYSSYLSDVDYLADGHYLIDFGGMIRLPDGTAVNAEHTTPEQRQDASQHTALIEILDDEIIFEVWLLGRQITNSYKAERMELYTGVTELLP